MVKKTETSSFGSVLREGHSSEKFYNSKLYKDFKIPETLNLEKMPLMKNT